MVIFPLAPDQTIAQMWSNGARGGATQKGQTTQKTTKQNYPGSVAFYDTQPGNMVGLFYNDPKPTWVIA